MNTARRLIQAPQVTSPHHALAVDDALVQTATQPTLRIWQNHPCVVLGRFDVRLQNIEQAIDAFGSKKMPLLKRSSGGTAVWHGPGVFNVSVFAPADEVPSGVHEAFESLAAGMVEGLETLNIQAEFGQVPGTYCDGPHNLVIEGKKVAGLAQTRKRNGVLVHASILTDLDLDEMHDWIEFFYEKAGQPQQFARGKVVTLTQALGANIDFPAFVEAMVKGYSDENHSIELGELTADEASLAENLSKNILLKK